MEYGALYTPELQTEKKLKVSPVQPKPAETKAKSAKPIEAGSKAKGNSVTTPTKGKLAQPTIVKVEPGNKANGKAETGNKPNGKQPEVKAELGNNDRPPSRGVKRKVRSPTQNPPEIKTRVVKVTSTGARTTHSTVKMTYSVTKTTNSPSKSTNPASKTAQTMAKTTNGSVSSISSIKDSEAPLTKLRSPVKQNPAQVKQNPVQVKQEPLLSLGARLVPAVLVANLLLLYFSSISSCFHCCCYCCAVIVFVTLVGFIVTGTFFSLSLFFMLKKFL